MCNVGFVVEGYQLPFEESCLNRTLSSVVEMLPEEKPRFIVGLYKPSEVLL